MPAPGRDCPLPHALTMLLLLLLLDLLLLLPSSAAISNIHPRMRRWPYHVPIHGPPQLTITSVAAPAAVAASATAATATYCGFGTFRAWTVGLADCAGASPEQLVSR